MKKEALRLAVPFLILYPALCLGIDLIKVNDNNALFTAFDKTIPVVSVNYVGWRKNWKWAGTTVNSKPIYQNNKYHSSQFTGQVDNLGLAFTGSVSPEVGQLNWFYSWDKSSGFANAIGFGLEFNLQLSSSSFHSNAQNPELLDDNKGWRWQTPDGQLIEVSFTPSLAKLYFERGQKNKIRTLFFSSIAKGSQQTTMSVKVSHSVDILGAENSKTKTWHKNVLPALSSPVDLSFLNSNDLPAGKHGFIRRNRDQLSFDNGVPVKFWGANIQAYALFKTSNADIKRHAKRIAQLGFNLIRIHHHDSSWVEPNVFENPLNNTLKLSSSALEKLDWWIKCLKDEGVYLWLDLHVGRTFTQNDGLTDFEDFAKGKITAEVKGFNYYNESIQSAMQAFNTAYLNHVNQFTQLAYKDDPAVIALLLTNENDLTHHFANALLANKGVPIHHSFFEKDVKKFSDSHDLPYYKTLRTWEIGESKIYLNDAEHRFNKTMLNHLKGMGIKSLVATTNSWGGMGLFSLPALTDGSIIDAHSYGRDGEIKSNPRFNPNFLSWIGGSQITGYPLSVTEWNIEPFPASDRFIAPIYTASIASLQGWDALMLYGYSQAPLDSWENGSNYSSYNDPAIMGLMPASALLYRGNHVASAKNSYELKLARDDFFFKQYGPHTSKTIRTLLETSRLTVGMPKTTELPWLTKNIHTDNRAIIIRDPNKDFIPANQNFVESDTGELKRDWEAGVHTINTPKSQVVSGWVGGKRIRLKNVEFNISTKKAVVAIQSLTDLPIIKSEKIFITLMARSKPEKGNHLPFLSEPVLGQVFIAAPEGLRFYPVNNLGGYDKPISLLYKQGRYILTFCVDSTFHWGVLQK